ncbi:carboxymethylenebutenolidase [Ranunculus cassubicifolius]
MSSTSPKNFSSFRRRICVKIRRRYVLNIDLCKLFEPASFRVHWIFPSKIHAFSSLPDLFRGNPWTRGDQSSSEFEEWVSNLPSERVVKDVKVSAKWMMDEFLAAGISKKLGLIGFGFGGGRLIDVLSQDTCFSTAVCFYGTQMPTSLDDIKVPVLFISGDSDPLCPIQTLKKYEEGIGKGSRLVVFKGQGHAFAHMPDSPEADQVAEEAFVITRNWLHDGLAGSINN